MEQDEALKSPTYKLTRSPAEKKMRQSSNSEPISNFDIKDDSFFFMKNEYNMIIKIGWCH